MFLCRGLIKPSRHGVVLHGITHNADWYPTLATLAGASPHDPAAPGVTGIPGVDGFDMWPYITGTVAESPRVDVLISSGADHGDGSGTIVSGDLKLIFGVQRLSCWTSQIYPNASVPAVKSAPFDCGHGCLFNVRLLLSCS